MMYKVELLQHMLIQRQIGDELLELAVLILELAQPSQLGHSHSGEFLLPAIKGLLTDAELPTDLGDRCSRFYLAYGIRHLLFSEGRFPHLILPSLGEHSNLSSGPAFWGGSIHPRPPLTQAR